MTTKTTSPAATPTHWGKPVTYTVHGGGGKLLATTDGGSRTVTTLRAGDAAQVSADLNRLGDLVDLGWMSQRLAQLQRAGVDTSTLTNNDQPADDRTGAVWHLSRLLEVDPATLSGFHNPAMWLAGPLLRLLAAVADEPEASGRALRGELARILTALDGTVVRAEYELSGWFNIAPWIDTLDVADLKVLLLEDGYAHVELCHRLLTDWSFPGGVLEDNAARIDNDPDFALLIAPSDVVRRLHTTRPQVLAAVYADDPTNDGQASLDGEFTEAAALARTLLH